MDVSVDKSGNNSRTYSFSEDIGKRSLKWLDSRHIETYEVKGRTLSITAKPGTDWDQLEHDFIMPGLQRTFGELNVKQHAHS